MYRHNRDRQAKHAPASVRRIFSPETQINAMVPVTSSAKFIRILDCFRHSIGGRNHTLDLQEKDDYTITLAD